MNPLSDAGGEFCARRTMADLTRDVPVFDVCQEFLKTMGWFQTEAVVWKDLENLKLKTTIKIALKGFIDSVVILIGKTTIGRYLYSQIINNAMSLTQEVAHHGVSLIFSTPNALNKFRADTFSSKEPETLEWLDNIPENSVVWDIGANVGLYSCYAAKARSCRVFAFEPSVFNLEFLARNIYLNKLTELVTIIP